MTIAKPMGVMSRKLRSPEKAQKGYRGGKPKAVYVDMGIWRDKKTDHIHMSLPTESDFITTVTKKPGKRCHKNLYQKLERILRKQKGW